MEIQYPVKATLINSILRDLFIDLGRNIKTPVQLHFICEKDGIKIRIGDTSREMFEEIYLKHTLFQTYQYQTGLDYLIGRFQLKKFLLMTCIFSQPKALLTLSIDSHGIKVASYTANSSTQLEIPNLSGSAILAEEDLRQSLVQKLSQVQLDSVRIEIAKHMFFKEVIYTFGLSRCTGVKMTYHPHKKSIDLTAIPQGYLKFSVSVKQIHLSGTCREFAFSVKKIKTALSLSKFIDSTLIMTLHEDYLLMQAQEVNAKSAAVKIFALKNE